MRVTFSQPHSFFIPINGDTSPPKAPPISLFLVMDSYYPTL